jgi:predicted ribosomally synthesized peptide with SipW-like signal peptide
MKKIIGLTVAALMVMGLVGGGTWAYFSDTESSTGNVFAAGTLDLEVDSANPWASAYVSISDMQPGQATTNTTIQLENIGNLTGDLYMRITGVTDGGGAAIYNGASSEPEYVAEGGPGSWVAVDDISDNLTITCQAEIDGGAMAAITNIDSEYISDAETNSWQKVYDAMGQNDTMNFTLYATLHQDADNHVQGDNCTFSIEFQLLQEDQSP